MILFLISLILVIIIHELAHLIAAKSVGCQVEKFSIGFGKPILWSKKIGNTIYQITPWILGGYNQLKGELTLAESLDSFSNLKYWKKLLISLIGVFVNIVLGIIAIYLSIKLKIYGFFYFGYISFLLGITNALPIPALDGSYPFLILLEKFIPKEKALKILNKIMRISLIILTILNIICLPWFFLYGYKLMNEQILMFWHLIY